MIMLPDHMLVYVDIGSWGGSKHMWDHYPHVFHVCSDPNDQAVNYPHNQNHLFLDQALGAHVSEQLLYITRSPGCCSLLKPNVQFLANYSVKPAFDIVDVKTVKVVPYSQLVDLGQAPVPDVIKIDVQGYEMQVLQGFGDLLHGVIAIELETSVYPIYENQHTLNHITQFLAQFGFVLHKLTPIPHWDNSVVEFDAVFLNHALNLQDATHNAKHHAVLRTFDIKPKQRIFSKSTWD
jgi:FkbM family methyltransferase